MATDKLSLYNDALLLLGQRKLASLTEDREPRYRLDDSYDLDAIRYCLELVKPNFATATATLNTPTAGSTFDYVHALPAGYVCIVEPFSDQKTDHKISRYVIEGQSLLCDYATVYLRYVIDSRALTVWVPSFIRVMSAYLANELSVRLSPEEQEVANTRFQARVEEARALEAAKVPDRPKSSTAVLTNSWRKVYNDALMLLGLDELTSNNDDSDRKVKLDRTLDAGIVGDLLEDTGWQFSFVSTRIDFDPSAEPAWGFTYAHRKPSDLHRIDGIYTDEYTGYPLKRYRDEGDYWFTDLDQIYVTYVSTTFLTTPDAWPLYFKRLVAARMARDAATSLGIDQMLIEGKHEERERNAYSTDAQASPPRKLATGNWVDSRNRGRGANRDRP